MSNPNDSIRNSYQLFPVDNGEQGAGEVFSGNGYCEWSSTDEVPSSLSDNLQHLSRYMAFDDTIQSLARLMEATDKNPRCDCVNEHFSKEYCRGRTLSTEGVVRVAAAHFIQLYDLLSSEHCEQTIPLELLHLSLTSDEVRDVELASHLIDAAEKVHNQQFDRANSLLQQCFFLSSPSGNPVERVVHYFSQGLQDRILRETGKGCLEFSNEMETMAAYDVINATLVNHQVHLIANNALPFLQIFNSISVQAILDNMASAKCIHIVDFAIRHGFQWRILMQVLATRDSCPVESLKISAVGASDEVITTVGKSLSSLAESLRLPFKFKAVLLQDMKNLREDMFHVEEGEALGISSHLVLNTLIVEPENIEKVMRVIRKLRPCVMVVMDVEAYLNSPSFINRFTEALFFFSAYFDCLYTLMKKSDRNRMMIEKGFFSQIIKTVIATEGSERVMRRVGIQVWRSFFTRFGFVEIEFSELSKNQATYLIKKFFKDGSGILERNGKSLLIEWKGTPLHFLSAWKFQ